MRVFRRGVSGREGLFGRPAASYGRTPVEFLQSGPRVPRRFPSLTAEPAFLPRGIFVAVTGWRLVVYLLPLLVAPSLPAVEGPADAARELARRLAGGFRGPISFTLRNLSDLAPGEVAEFRRALENELRGTALVEAGAADELHVTLSQNFATYVVAAEVKRGEERQVILFAFKRVAGTIRAGPSAVTVDKSLIASLADPILDVARVDADLLLLQTSRITRYAAANGHWEARESAPLGPLALPRDPRGRLMVQSGAYLAYVSGSICSGAVQPLDARCRDADEAWPLVREPALRAYPARGRNYFDGRVSAPGVSKTVPPFYTAAHGPSDQWIFARLDGRVWLHDASLEPVAAIGAWGSDIAGVATRCGPGSLLLSTRPGDGTEKDSIRVYQVVDRQAVEAASAVEMPGPVVALWTVDESSAVAVVRDLGSGEYAAYRLSISCSH